MATAAPDTTLRLLAFPGIGIFKLTRTLTPAEAKAASKFIRENFHTSYHPEMRAAFYSFLREEYGMVGKLGKAARK